MKQYFMKNLNGSGFTLLTLFALLLSCPSMAQQNANKGASAAQTQTSGVNKQDNDKNNLVPRVALTGIHDSTTVKGNPTNTLVYNTAKTGNGTERVYPGYYQNTGTKNKPVWKRLEVTVSEAVKNKEH